jgi:hypothetical protein
MDRVLSLREILDAIVENFEEERVRLLPLALVNRAFSEAALDRMWSRRTVGELAALMPAHLWEKVKDQSGFILLSFYVQVRLASPFECGRDRHAQQTPTVPEAELAAALRTSRFMFYSRRVQYLSFMDPGRRWAIAVHHSILAAWQSAQATLFPKLRGLYLNGDHIQSVEGMEHALNLISPHLTALSLDFDPKRADFLEHLSTGHREIMEPVITRSRGLKTVSVRLADAQQLQLENHSRWATAVCALICASPDLRDVRFTQLTSLLTYTALQHLASCPNLKRLHFGRMHHEPAGYSFAAGDFPKLEVLKWRCYDQEARMIRAFLARPPTTHLTMVSFHSGSVLMDVIICVQIARALGAHQSLTKVELMFHTSLHDHPMSVADASWALLDPLSGLVNIEFLNVTWNFSGIELTEAQVTQLLFSWPRLRACRFGPLRNMPSCAYPQVSWSAFFNILGRCPHVEWLPISVDLEGSDMPDSDALAQLQSRKHPFRGLWQVVATEHRDTPELERIRQALPHTKSDPSQLAYEIEDDVLWE